MCRGERNRTPTRPRLHRRAAGPGQLDLLTDIEEAPIMGWASGADIFDRVARSLINAHVDEDTKRQVLGEPIDSLQDSDWDTEDESLERFRDDAVIVELFAQRGIHLDPEDDA